MIDQLPELDGYTVAWLQPFFAEIRDPAKRIVGYVTELLPLGGGGVTWRAQVVGLATRKEAFALLTVALSAKAGMEVA